MNAYAGPGITKATIICHAACHIITALKRHSRVERWTWHSVLQASMRMPQPRVSYRCALHAATHLQRRFSWSQVMKHGTPAGFARCLSRLLSAPGSMASRVLWTSHACRPRTAWPRNLDLCSGQDLSCLPQHSASRLLVTSHLIMCHAWHSPSSKLRPLPSEPARFCSGPSVTLPSHAATILCSAIARVAMFCAKRLVVSGRYDTAHITSKPSGFGRD